MLYKSGYIVILKKSEFDCLIKGKVTLVICSPSTVMLKRRHRFSVTDVLDSFLGNLYLLYSSFVTCDYLYITSSLKYNSHDGLSL